MDRNILTKSYKLNRSINYELFLREAGASRTILDHVHLDRPSIELRKYVDHYVLSVFSEHSKRQTKFQPNKMFVQDSYGGKKVQTVMTFHNGHILREMQAGPKPVTVIRDFSPKYVKETMVCKNVICYRYYTPTGY